MKMKEGGKQAETCFLKIWALVMIPALGDIWARQRTCGTLASAQIFIIPLTGFVLADTVQSLKVVIY